MLTITPTAAKRILQVSMEAGECPLLRVAALRLDDGSIDFGMGFDEWRSGDIRIICEGVAVVVAPPSRELLDEVTLDYLEVAPGDARFVFAAKATADATGDTAP